MLIVDEPFEFWMHCEIFGATLSLRYLPKARLWTKCDLWTLIGSRAAAAAR